VPCENGAAEPVAPFSDIEGKACVSTRTKRRIALIKDLILFSIGSGGIIYQIVTNQANIALLMVCTALVGLNAIAGLTSIARGTPTESRQPSSTSDYSEPDSDSA